jgi:hypothetical protein
MFEHAMIICYSDGVGGLIGRMDLDCGVPQAPRRAVAKRRVKPEAALARTVETTVLSRTAQSLAGTTPQTAPAYRSWEKILFYGAGQHFGYDNRIYRQEFYIA